MDRNFCGHPQWTAVLLRSSTTRGWTSGSTWHLCHTEGLCLQVQRPEDSFHSLVFTDVDGNRTYGVVLTFWRPVQANIIQNGSVRHLSRSCGMQFFFPTGICITSKRPYYTALTDCLSSFLAELKSSSRGQIESKLLEFSAKMALIPCPPVGLLYVKFTLKPLEIILPPPFEPDQLPVDLALHIPFLCFSPSQVVQILTCLLTEQQVVLLCSNIALLTPLAEALLALLRPLRWRHALVPILADQMLDFIEAPTVFLMGCHVQHRSIVQQVPDLVMVNVDSRAITSAGCDTLINVPNMPCAAKQQFLNSVQALRMHYDLEVIGQGESCTFDESRQRRRLWQWQMNQAVSDAALQFVITLFRDVSQHLNYEHRVFNREQFLKDQESLDLPFYTKVLKTDMFITFLKERLSRTTDAFSRIEQSTRSQSQRQRHDMWDSPRKLPAKVVANKMQPICKLENINQTDQQVCMAWKKRSIYCLLPQIEPVRKQPMREMHTFSLPSIPSNAQHEYAVKIYYKDCNERLSRYITNLEADCDKESATAEGKPSLRASGLCLRGCMHASSGRPLEALADLAGLARCDMAAFPRAVVRAIVQDLEPKDRRLAEKRPELAHLLREIAGVTESPQENQAEGPTAENCRSVKNFSLPKKHLQVEDFVRCVQESGIAQDRGSIQRLFSSLTLGQQKQVDPTTFEMFHKAWKETEQETHDLHLPRSTLENLDKNECVYKVSPSIKTSLGQGRLAMTQRRLFLLAEGKGSYIEVALYRNIEEVEATSVISIFPPRVPALKIKIKHRSEAFTANLKSDRDLWHLMVKEMWAGKQTAHHHKDPQILKQAATNVLLMDALVQCLQSSKAIYAATKLAHFTDSEMTQLMPKTTVETLRGKISPSAGLASPEAVDALLYTTGTETQPHEGGTEGVPPRLWCTTGNGRVSIFNTTTWSKEQDGIRAGHKRLTCILAVGHMQVWVGSVDGTIYILDTRSLSFNKQLSEHRESVTSLLFSHDDPTSSKWVISCSIDGRVVAWNPITLQVHHSFHIPNCSSLTSMMNNSDSLWCCLGKSIEQFTLRGKPLCKLSIVEAQRPQGFSCFALIPKAKLWTASREDGNLQAWDPKKPQGPMRTLQLPDCAGIKSMICVGQKLWVGGVSDGPDYVGKVYVVDTENYTIERELKGHVDSVTCLLHIKDRYVLSGSGRRDGKVAIWQII
uniref:DENN domain-containing protein 3 isoform X3 n=1 Tax=Myxine glutinosa TaxID=7769 RepID=UPI00358EBBC7